MTQATHTPGPWGTDGYTVFRRRQVGETLSTNIAQVLEIPGGYTLDMMAQRRANACLIAAAPDLLAALEDAVEALTEARYYPSELQRFQAAIAKAKGE